MALLDEGVSDNTHNDNRKPLHFVFKRSNSANDLDFIGKLNADFLVNANGSIASNDTDDEHDEVFVREKAKSVRKLSRFEK